MYNPQLTLGVELEVEIEGDPNPTVPFIGKNPVFSSHNKTDTSKRNHPKHGNLVKAVEDSCDNEILVAYDATLIDGFEFIGMPRNLTGNKTMWNRLLSNNKVTDYLRADDTVIQVLNGHQVRSAGMHVHMSGDPLSPLTMGKMMFFMNSAVNAILIQHVAGREMNNFCRQYNYIKPNHALYLYHTKDCPKKGEGKRIQYRADGAADVFITKEAQDVFGNKSIVATICCDGGIRARNVRFERGALWPTPGRNTGECEVRVFKSTLKLERFMTNLEFCVALVDFCQQATLPDLTAVKFSAWMNSLTQRLRYRNLFKHLRTGGFCAGLIPTSMSFQNMVDRGRVPELIKAQRMVA